MSAKQVYVDFELPEAMYKDINVMMKRKFPNWIVDNLDNGHQLQAAISVRVLWLGWLFLKYSEGIAGKYEGRFPGVTYTPYTAIDRPVVFQTVMLESQYIDAMERMARLYPQVFNDESLDKNYFLAQLGYAGLRELFDDNLEIRFDPELSKQDNLEHDPQAQLNYSWLVDGTNKPFPIRVQEMQK